MIAFLHGELLEARPTGIVVGVNGVGYELVIPLSSFDRLPKKGECVRILTHLHVREDGMELYGFMTEDERSLFRLLLGVSGIGPKIAISILSGISPQNFYAAVRQGSAQMLAMVPGIGKKKAERLVVELKDRIGRLEAVAGRPEVSSGERVIDDAARALISLGYTQSEAQKAIHAALQRIGTPGDVEKLIREALKPAR
jgi:Holliday junction DNA helicase RuvA